MICRDCGKMVLPKEGHIIDGEFYCNDCIVKCIECGEYILKDDAIKTHDGEFICESCKEDNYYTCEDCGELYHQNDLTWIEDKQMYVCETCLDGNYYKCECCNKYFSSNGCYETYDHNWVCSDCYDNSYRTCEDCGLAVHDDDYYYNESDGCSYCPDCEGNHQSSIYGYHDYECFCKKQVYCETGTKEFFGLEIEVSGDSDYADEFLDIVPDVVLMSDSSINGGGFEIVTEPMTRGYIAEKFLPNIEKGMKFLNDNGFRGHNKGGIHIHVSQEVFSKKMLCALRNILYSGLETNMEVWKAITQRHQSEIDSWCKYTNARSITDIFEDSRQYPYISNDGRYTALNYDSRTGTYEFRIFNSNTRIERIKKNIQTVYSLVDYAKHKEETYHSASTGDYLEFVKENKALYPDLFSFMYEMGIVQRFEEERIAA